MCIRDRSSHVQEYNSEELESEVWHIVMSVRIEACIHIEKCEVV